MSVYNSNRLEWHRDDEVIYKPRRFLCGLVVRQASLLSHFNRLAVALAKSQDHRASCGVFSFGTDRVTRVKLLGLHGLPSQKTPHSYTPESKRRPALIERLVKQLVHGGEQGQLYKRINPSSALGAFWFF